MLTDSLEHQLPIDAIEEALDVEIKHPVVAPTALTSRAHGIDRRFAGSVAVRIRLKHRLHDRLQIGSGDLLSDGARGIVFVRNAGAGRVALARASPQASHGWPPRTTYTTGAGQ